jgi:hypothetical protein
MYEYDIDDDDLDALDADLTARARAYKILDDLEARRASGYVRPVYVQLEPQPAITIEQELMDANHMLIDTAMQDLDSNDPGAWARAAETLDRFEVLKRATARARNQPGRLA